VSAVRSPQSAALFDVAPGLRLTSGGAAWLPDHAAAVIADVHLGYARAARRRGGYLPNAETAAAVARRVLALAGALGARRLVVAGDLRHSTRDADAAAHAEVAEFLDRLSALERVDLVAGNHDRGAANMSARVSVGDVDVVHEPPREAPARWTVCGHLHPSATVRDETGAGARYPCALVGPRVLVLPAFTEWAGGVHASRVMDALPPGPWRRVVTAGGVVLPLD
jgi:putative SbcD/Mre11-related phosphoesterase